MKKNEIRQQQVLKYLVKEFIQTSEPVSSKLINEKYIQNSSPATIRIDLNKLEKENFIYQPHTSAGRIPTITGYRCYLEMLAPKLNTIQYEKNDILRNILIKYYKDIPLALHYIMQFLARETDQLSFVAEPEVSYGYLEKLDVFKIAENKLLFVVSLDSGLDKTVILKWDHGITEQQLKAVVRYVNDKFAGHRIYDIQHRYLEETSDKISEENKLLKYFLDEMEKAISEISSYFIHFDGNISFLEQPEFDDKSSILAFLGFIQKQDYLVNLMQRYDKNKPYTVVMGEDIGHPELSDYTLIFSRYEIFGIPGYLGVLGPIRMNYEKNIPIIRDMAQIITKTTKKGMVVPKNDR
ncbi:MAG: heat-inducible transcriptional repressor HrcA [Candidatus Cloacimonetes bacterium]|nr:heat-inducible transcriptional repressor HrcA [Candidatus Cloacimonadota bacterium]MCF7814063.1 heat-inducible transcriptional repressor HrcA [Candidatus Cloacimonadota bacterium]MCF7868635.1 heat-inducible transcriptional repressor HrcA [Candidatus Cloacimonadota bacterium]MCF7884090.1 heat-inducible transcriptional repressor HrcA [Candidatus Cloacimonadota bacterium]